MRELRRQVQNLARQLQAEEADVERLDRLSLKSVVLGFLGSRDDAQRAAQSAQYALDRFSRELKDVHRSTSRPRVRI